MNQIVFNGEEFSIVYHRKNALELWKADKTNGHPAANMNLKLVKIREALSGFGIYSLSYKDPKFGERIIYVGKYAGKKTIRGGVNIDDAISGDVRDRWFKHIGTATLLLANLKMSSSKKFLQHKEKSRSFFADSPEFSSVLKNSFLGLSERLLKENVFLTGKDLQVSGSRLGFAIQNLTWTNKPHPNTEDELNTVLSKFTCHYWQVVPRTATKKSDINESLEGKNEKKGVELEIINKYYQKLPMNHKYKIPQDLKNYYHYDPENLIEVSDETGAEFSEYKDFIVLQLKSLINLACKNSLHQKSG